MTKSRRAFDGLTRSVLSRCLRCLAAWTTPYIRAPSVLYFSPTRTVIEAMSLRQLCLLGCVASAPLLGQDATVTGIVTDSANALVPGVSIKIRTAAQDPSAALPQQSNASDRFQYYLQRTYSWQRMSWLAADTGIDHLLHESEWGRGMGGYGCHYASGFGRRLINNSVEFGAVLVLRQDTRFRPSQRVGLFPRLHYAVTHAFLATSERGRIEPAYARFAGITGGALIAPAWHRHTLSASGFGQDLAFSALDQVQNSLLTEFSPDMQRVGRVIRKRLLRR